MTDKKLLNKLAEQIGSVLDNREIGKGAGVVLIGEIENDNFSGSVQTHGNGLEVMLAVIELCEKVFGDEEDFVKEAFLEMLSIKLNSNMEV